MSAKGLQAHLSRWGSCPTLHNPAEIGGAKFGPVYNVNSEFVKPNKKQPRFIFTPARMAELRSSIEKRGIIEPLKARVVGRGGGMCLELIDGERRLRTAKAILYGTVPCIISPPFESEKEFHREAFVAGDLHDDLNPIEKALALRGLLEDYNCNQTELAAIIDRSPFYISNAMQYLNLTDELQKAVIDGKIPLGVGKELASHPHDKQKHLSELLKKASEKKGRPLTQFEVRLILRREADRLKIKRPRDEPKKGRVPYNSNAYLASRATALINQLNETLTEISKASKADVEANSSFYLGVFEGLSSLLPLCERVKEKLDGDVT